MFFGLNSEETEEMDKVGQMNGICRSVSSKISAVFSAGDGTSAYAKFPQAVSGQNISIWAFGQKRTIIVRDKDSFVACPTNINMVTDGNGSDFEIPKNATLKNVGGVVWIG
jgi:hypothetical protein